MEVLQFVIVLVDLLDLLLHADNLVLQPLVQLLDVFDRTRLDPQLLVLPLCQESSNRRLANYNVTDSQLELLPCQPASDVFLYYYRLKKEKIIADWCVHGKI